MKKAIFILLLVMVIVACKDDNEEDLHVQTAIDVGASIFVSNDVGTDLLNPSNPKAFTETDIKIYYLIDGEKEEVYDPNLKYPRNFSITKPESGGKFDKYRMRLFLNYDHDREDEYSITYIHWKEDIDTIKATFIWPGEAVVRCSTIWYNGNLVYTLEDDGDLRNFKIIKNPEN